MKLWTSWWIELFQFRCNIVVSISAGHAEDPGSIPGRGGFPSVAVHTSLQFCMSGMKHCGSHSTIVVAVEKCCAKQDTLGQDRTGQPLLASCSHWKSTLFTVHFVWACACALFLVCLCELILRVLSCRFCFDQRRGGFTLSLVPSGPCTLCGVLLCLE